MTVTVDSTPQAVEAPQSRRAVDPNSGALLYTSVSAIDRFDPKAEGCPRKWYFRYVLGIPDPPTEAQAFGVARHAELKHYFTLQRDVLHERTRAGMRFLPNPNPTGLLVEHELDVCPSALVTPPRFGLNGVPFLGAIDIVNMTGTWIDDDGVSHNAPKQFEIIDWKFSSNVERYAKTEFQLKKNRQVAIYAKWVYEHFPWLDSVRVSHGTFQSKGKRQALKTTAVLHLDEVNEICKMTSDVISEMRDVARVKDVNDAPANQAACNTYNRPCPYASQCNAYLSAAPTHFSNHTPHVNGSIHTPHVNGNNVTSLLDFFKANVAPATPPSSRAVQPSATPNPSAPPAAPARTPLNAESLPDVRGVDPRAATKDMLEAELAATLSTKGAPRPAYVSVLPPDAPLPTPPKPLEQVRAEAEARDEDAKKTPPIRSREHHAAVSEAIHKESVMSTPDVPKPAAKKGKQSRIRIQDVKSEDDIETREYDARTLQPVAPPAPLPPKPSMTVMPPAQPAHAPPPTPAAFPSATAGSPMGTVVTTARSNTSPVAGTRVRTICIRKGMTVNLGNYNSFKAEVELDVELDDSADYTGAFQALSKHVMETLNKELEPAEGLAKAAATTKR